MHDNRPPHCIVTSLVRLGELLALVIWALAPDHFLNEKNLSGQLAILDLPYQAEEAISPVPEVLSKRGIF